MKNQDKLFTTLRFVVGLASLCFGLIQFSLALTYRPLDNHFLGGVLGIPLAILLTLLFALGWWFEWLFEKVVSNNGRTAALVFLFSTILIYLISGVVSFLIPIGLFSFAFVAGASVAFGSFWLQLSRLRPEIAAKIRNRVL